MGKGIALQFKNKWPANFSAYHAACKAGEVRPGKMMVFEAGAYAQPHFIINFPTKDHWRGNSRLSFIEDGLIDLVKQIRALDIRSIASAPGLRQRRAGLARCETAYRDGLCNPA